MINSVKLQMDARIMENNLKPEIEYSEEYVAKRQKEGMFDCYQGNPPEYPDDVHYMQGYNSLK